MADLARNCWTAVHRAWADAWRGTREFTRQHWRIESCNSLAAAILFAIGLGGANTLRLPTVVVALMGFVATMALIAFSYFVAVLVWTPWRDHRKLVQERDTYEHKVRTVHLRVQAHDWATFLNQEWSAANKAIQRPAEHFDANQHVNDLLSRLKDWIDYLTRFGQPTLAAKLENLGDKRPKDAKEYLAIIDVVRPIVAPWGCGEELPPFAADASEAGLLIPMLYTSQ